MSLDASYELVEEFHSSFGVPICKKPTLLSSERVQCRSRWLIEEVHELTCATTTVEQVDAVIDVLYLALGALVEMGVRPDVPFKIVHESNMAKVDETGSARLSPDGKVCKPNNWQSPSKMLMRELDRQADGSC